jgi:hypothetical protein
MSNFSDEAVSSLRRVLNDTSKDVLVSLIENMLAKFESTNKVEYVHQMRLCEQGFLILHPNELYLFTVDHNCKKCIELAGSR